MRVYEITKEFKMFENKYCTIKKENGFFVLHSKKGTYSDKKFETLRGVSLATQIPLSVLNKAFEDKFLAFAAGYSKNIQNFAK